MSEVDDRLVIHRVSKAPEKGSTVALCCHCQTAFNPRSPDCAWTTEKWKHEGNYFKGRYRRCDKVHDR